MHKTFTSFCFALLSMTAISYAQNRTISGQVKDAGSGETIPGVHVFVKNDSLNGTATDINGAYSLSVSSITVTLVFESIGYEQKQIPVGSSNVINVSMEAANVNLNTVVVSASRRQEKILDAPASISVISSKQLNNTVALSVTQDLKGVPGVDIMNTGLVQANVVVRGFNNIFSGELLTMVDNRYATVPSLRVNVNMFIPTDNTDIERIEVLRGPASALYGPDCADGVLHIITKDPLDQDKNLMVTASVGIGFRSKISDTIAIANPIDGTTGQLYSDYKPEFDDPNLGDRMMYSAMLRISEKVNTHFGYKILLTYFKGRDWKYDDPFEPSIIVKGYETDAGRVNTSDSIPNNRDYNLSKTAVDTRFDYKFNNASQLILTTGLSENDDIEMTGIGAGQGLNWKYYYTQLRYLNKNMFAQAFVNGSNSGDTYLLRTGDQIIDHSKLYAAQIQNANDFLGKKLNVVYGADMILTRPDTQGTINGRNENDDNINEYGVYSQGKYSMNPMWDFVGALRLDYHNFVNTPFLSPRAGIVYKPNPRQTFRITYNRAFSAPTSNELNLDILQINDLGDLGAYGQGLFGLDYDPEIGVRAIGNRGGFDYQYDDQGLPEFRSPYSQALGLDLSNYYSLASPNLALNNYAWQVALANIVDGFSAASGLPPSLVSQIIYPLVPDSIYGISNDIKLLNLTTAQFDPVDPKNVKNYGPIENSPTNTYELGWKGSLVKDKIFATVDVYRNDMKNFVSPLTNITPNVFLDYNALVNYLTPLITGYYADSANAVIVGILNGALDANGNGTSLDEFIPTVAGAASSIPFGTVEPTQYNDASIYVTYVNIGNITTYGADLGVAWYVNDKLLISLAYSWVNKDSVPVDGAQLGYVALNAPKNKIGVRVSYDVPKTDLNVGLNFRWQQKFPANSGAYVGTVDDINDLDLTLNYSPHYLKNTQFALTITNLYDNEQQYFVGAPVIGTTAFFKITKSF